MLSDRRYMRDVTPPSDVSPLVWLVGCLFAFYVVENILLLIWPAIVWDWVALTPRSLLQGKIWTLLTYSFVHDPLVRDPLSSRNQALGILHIIGNALLIFSFGRSLLNVLGTRVFLGLYFGAVLAGGMLWFAVNHTGTTPLIGASAGAMGILALFCLMFPNDRITLLLFWVLPITVVPKFLLLVSAAMTTLFFVFAELFPGARDNIAHSAHLGGLIAGLIAYRYLRLPGKALEALGGAAELPRWLQKKRITRSVEVPSKVNIPRRPNLKAEVDRILDKINTSGFGSLTPDEKRTLDEARALMTKR
jgi:membrane associated rhomboid family serine protease